MFISMLSTLDGFKLTLPNGGEVKINLVRTAGMNVATLSIDCPDDVLIEKTESTLPELERVKQELIQEIDKLTIEYNPLVREKAQFKRSKGKNKNQTNVNFKKTRLFKPRTRNPVKSSQPNDNSSKKFPSGDF